MSHDEPRRMAVSPPHEMSPDAIHSSLEAGMWANAPEVPGMEPNYIPKQYDQTMRVLITGINGSGGSYMADYAVSQGAEVHGLARWHTSPATQGKKPYTVHECDLMDMGSILRVLETVRPHVIFHLASHANVRACFETPTAVLQNNILGTANLLEAIRSLGLKLQTRFVMCSSSEVYGQVDKDSGPLDEATPLRPVSPYAVSKLTQDTLSHSYFLSFGIPVVRTRMFTYLNPRRADLFATSFAMQVARIEKGRQDTLRHGNLDSVRTVLDVRDAVSAYWLAAMKGIPGEVYNIGGTETVTVGSFLETLKSLATCPIPSEPDPALMRPADVTLQIPDCRKFKERTGWEPKISFADSVKFLLDHCRAVA